MPLDIRQFPCLSDNYGFLVRDVETGAVACVDTPSAPTILEELERSGWGRLDLILNTHWHPDHAGGNAAVQAGTGAKIVAPEAERERIGQADRWVAEGDAVDLGATTFQVLDTRGHTRGHVSYVAQAERVAFVGDTLFALGCGRLFEGAAEQMWTSLNKLAALPADTRLYCAHEYTASNARFALSVDDDPAVAERAASVFAARERGEPTVPTTVGAERATSPFLRAPQVARSNGWSVADDVEAFARVRAAKDAFKG